MNVNPQRIAFFMPDLQCGGVQRTFITLSNELARKGHPVDLVVCSGEGPNGELVDPSVHLVDLGKTRTALALFALAKYLKDRQPRCLISGMEHASNLAILAKRLSHSKVKVVASIRNTLSVQYGPNSSLKMRLSLWLAKLLYPRADLISAVSRECADDAAEVLGIDAKRIGHIYNPTVNPNLFEKAKEEADHPWLQDHSQPVIVAIGRLDAQKDYPMLFQAFAKVISKRACRLIILGDGDLRNQLEELAVSLGIAESVSMPGFTPNPYAYLARADVYALSSQFEGLPNVLIEALASGIPIVSTNCKSGPKEILAEGKWGKIVPVGDVEAMAKALEAQIIAGRTPRPPESYAPFMLQTVSEQYLRMATDA